MALDSSVLSLADRVLEAAASPPSNLFSLARSHVLDTIGVTLAGINHPSVKGLANTLSDTARDSALTARALGGAAKLSRRDAATLNGMAGHIHDFDDDDPFIVVGHPSVPVLAALLAVSDTEDVPISRALTAYLIGVETMFRIGALINPDHYNRGWHATATLGTFGAAAASGIVMNLERQALASAFNFAATLTNGLKANFGSDAKAFQVGAAAGNGLWAADLARQGLVAGDSAFGSQGFINLMGDGRDCDAVVAAFAQPWGIVNPGVNIKKYPCCSSAHTALDGLFEILNQTDWTPCDIANMDAWIGPDVPAILMHDIPRNGLEGKFSLRYCLAAAACLGELNLDAFESARINDPSIHALMQRIRIRIDSSLPRVATGVTHQSRLLVTSTSGITEVREIALPEGSPQKPLSDENLRAKFVSCASRGVGSVRALAIWDAIQDLDRLSAFENFLDVVMKEPA